MVFQKAIKRAAPDESLATRVLNLIDSITFSLFQYTTQGLFECDKLTYTAQVTFQVNITVSRNLYAMIYFTGKAIGTQRKLRLSQLWPSASEQQTQGLGN